MRLEFTVRGIPVPQGSLVRSPSGGLYHRGHGKLEDWRRAIATEARAEIGDRPMLEGPVAIRARFTWPRPKGHRASSGALRPAAPRRKTTPPDVDKTARALLDALTGVVFRDDAQVVRLDVGKGYDDETPGVFVIVEEEDAL